MAIKPRLPGADKNEDEEDGRMDVDARESISRPRIVVPVPNAAARRKDILKGLSFKRNGATTDSAQGRGGRGHMEAVNGSALEGTIDKSEPRKDSIGDQNSSQDMKQKLREQALPQSGSNPSHYSASYPNNSKPITSHTSHTGSTNHSRLSAPSNLTSNMLLPTPAPSMSTSNILPQTKISNTMPTLHSIKPPTTSIAGRVPDHSKIVGRSTKEVLKMLKFKRDAARVSTATTTTTLQLQPAARKATESLDRDTKHPPLARGVDGRDETVDTKEGMDRKRQRDTKDVGGGAEAKRGGKRVKVGVVAKLETEDHASLSRGTRTGGKGNGKDGGSKSTVAMDVELKPAADEGSYANVISLSKRSRKKSDAVLGPKAKRSRFSLADDAAASANRAKVDDGDVQMRAFYVEDMAPAKGKRGRKSNVSFSTRPPLVDGSSAPTSTSAKESQTKSKLLADALPPEKCGRPPKLKDVAGIDKEKKRELIEDISVDTVQVNGGDPSSAREALAHADTPSAPASASVKKQGKKAKPGADPDAPPKKRGRPPKSKGAADIDMETKRKLVEEDIVRNISSAPISLSATKNATKPKSHADVTPKKRGRPPNAPVKTVDVKETKQELVEEGVSGDVLMQAMDRAVNEVQNAVPKSKGKGGRKPKKTPPTVDNGEPEILDQTASAAPVKGSKHAQKQTAPCDAEVGPASVTISTGRRPGRKPKNVPDIEQSITAEPSPTTTKAKGKDKADDIIKPGQPRWTAPRMKATGRKFKVVPKNVSMKEMGKMRAGSFQPRIWCSSREELVAILPELSASKLVNGITWELSETPMILLAEDMPIAVTGREGMEIDIELTRDFVCAEQDLINGDFSLVWAGSYSYNEKLVPFYEDDFPPFEDPGPSYSSPSYSHAESPSGRSTAKPQPLVGPSFKDALSPESILAHEPRSLAEGDKILEQAAKHFGIEFSPEIIRHRPRALSEADAHAGPDKKRVAGSDDVQLRVADAPTSDKHADGAATSSNDVSGVQVDKRESREAPAVLCFCSRFKFDPTCRICNSELSISTAGNHTDTDNTLRSEDTTNTPGPAPEVATRASSAPPTLQLGTATPYSPSPTPSDAINPALDALPVNLPDELQVLRNAFREGIPITLVTSRSKFMEHWDMWIPEEHAYVYLGYYKIQGVQQCRSDPEDVAVPGPGMVAGRTVWSFSLEYGDGGEHLLCPDVDRVELEYPWWSPPDNAEKAEILSSSSPSEWEVSFAKTGYNILPLSLLADFCYTTSDSYFPRGWYCSECGKLNYQQYMRHRKCSSSQCYNIQPLTQGYFHDLLTVRRHIHSTQLTLPLNTYPYKRIDGGVSEWTDYMVTISYFPVGQPDTTLGMKHISSGNFARLQVEPTTLLVEMQKWVPLRREAGDSKPYFVYSAGGEDVPWEDVPQVVQDARKLMEYRAVYYGEMDKTLSIDRLTMWGCVTPGTRKGNTLIRAKKHPVVLMALGCDVEITITKTTPLPMSLEPEVGPVDMPDLSGLIRMDEKEGEAVSLTKPPEARQAGIQTPEVGEVTGMEVKEGGVLEEFERETEEGEQIGASAGHDEQYTLAEEEGVTEDEEVSSDGVVQQAAEAAQNADAEQGADGTQHLAIDSPQEVAGTSQEEANDISNAEPTAASKEETVSETIFRPRATGKGRTSNNRDEITFTMVHGDVLILSEDDFQYSIKRTGTSILLIGSQGEGE